MKLKLTDFNIQVMYKLIDSCPVLLFLGKWIQSRSPKRLKYNFVTINHFSQFNENFLLCPAEQVTNTEHPGTTRNQQSLSKS